MAWNPDQYNQFKAERYAPFYDLLQLIEIKTGLDVVDLGCGTGELTHQLAEVLPDANILGIDSSAEMLDKAKAYANQRLRFEQKTIEAQLDTAKLWDLVFSNAAIQWVDDHEKLIPKIISCIKAGGQMVIQLPSQTENLLNKMLNVLVAEEPYVTALNNWSKPSPVLSTESYAQLVFEQGGKDINIYEKIYPIVVDDPDALYEFIAGTALLPYIEKLDGEVKADFVNEFKERIRKRFVKTPILYPFKRIIISAKF